MYLFLYNDFCLLVVLEIEKTVIGTYLFSIRLCEI